MNGWLKQWLQPSMLVLVLSGCVGLGMMIAGVQGDIAGVRGDVTDLQDDIQALRGSLTQTNNKIDTLANGMSADQRSIWTMLAASAERTSVLESVAERLERELDRVWAQFQRMGFSGGE